MISGAKSPDAVGEGSAPSPASSSSDATSSVEDRKIKVAPRHANVRGRDPRSRPLSERQTSPFRPASGTTYGTEPEPRIPVELLPDEMEVVVEVLQTGYCPYSRRAAFFAARRRFEQALAAEGRAA